MWGVQEQLQKCQGLIANDYFLAEVKDTFTEQARMAIFEVYCRIHQRINLDALAAQVRPSPPPTPAACMQCMQCSVRSATSWPACVHSEHHPHVF